MTKDEVQELLSLHRNLNEEEQIEAFIVIMENFVSLHDPCELFFASFSIEHFLNGYITGNLNENAENTALSEFLEKNTAFRWLNCCRRENNSQKEGQVLYYLCRFLTAKSHIDTVRELCREFLEREDREKQLDTITFSYLKHFAKENDNIKVGKKNPGKLLQADVYIRYSQMEARKQISRYFLDDPYESILNEYPAPIRGAMARLYYMQSLAEKQK